MQKIVMLSVGLFRFLSAPLMASEHTPLPKDWKERTQTAALTGNRLFHIPFALTAPIVVPIIQHAAGIPTDIKSSLMLAMPYHLAGLGIDLLIQKEYRRSFRKNMKPTWKKSEKSEVKKVYQAENQRIKNLVCMGAIGVGATLALMHAYGKKKS